MRFISGLGNCHYKGLYSCVLSERQDDFVGMRRVFYTDKRTTIPLFGGADFSIKAHNHRQDIVLTRLFGEVTNVYLKVGYGPMRVWCYDFGSAILDGKFSLKRMYCQDAQVKRVKLTSTPTKMHWSEVHTVEVEPNSAWLVEEFRVAPPNTSRIWSTDADLKLSQTGLYTPLSSHKLRALEKIMEARTIREATQGSHIAVDYIGK